MKLVILVTILIVCGCSKRDNEIGDIENEKDLLLFLNANNLIDTSSLLLEADYRSINIFDNKFKKVTIGTWPSYSLGDINDDGLTDVMVNRKSSTGIQPIVYSQTSFDSIFVIKVELGPKLTNTFGEIVKLNDGTTGIRTFRRSYNEEMDYFVNDTIYYIDSLYTNKTNMSSKGKVIDSIIIEEQGVWFDWKDRSSINFVDENYLHVRDFYEDSIWVDEGKLNEYYINRIKSITTTVDLKSGSQNFEADWTDDSTIKTIFYFQNHDSIVIEDYGLVGPISLKNLYLYNHELWTNIRN